MTYYTRLVKGSLRIVKCDANKCYQMMCHSEDNLNLFWMRTSVEDVDHWTRVNTLYELVCFLDKTPELPKKYFGFHPKGINDKQFIDAVVRASV